MPRYIAIIDQAEGMFGAAFPDAPGCTAMAESEDQVLADASAALAEWATDRLADGLDMPPPRSASDLLGDSEVREALGRGAFLVGIPLLLEAGRPARANISLDAQLLADIDAEARRRGVTRSAFLAAAARQVLKAS